jgi:hypothetical protein
VPDLPARSLSTHSQVRQYQVRRTGGRIDGIAVGSTDLDLGRLRERLGAALARAGPSRPEAVVRTAASPPRQANIGKPRPFVPLA